VRMRLPPRLARAGIGDEKHPPPGFQIHPITDQSRLCDEPAGHEGLL
jgi:hypothetical protein